MPAEEEVAGRHLGPGYLHNGGVSLHEARHPVGQSFLLFRVKEVEPDDMQAAGAELGGVAYHAAMFHVGAGAVAEDEQAVVQWRVGAIEEGRGRLVANRDGPARGWL